VHELTPEEANKFESAEEQEQQLDVKITLQLLQAVQMACTGRSYRGGGHQEHKLDRFFDDKFDFTRNYGETIGVFTSICYYQVRVTSSVSRNCTIPCLVHWNCVPKGICALTSDQPRSCTLLSLSAVVSTIPSSSSSISTFSNQSV
jgi:hypothetical protein